MLHLGYKNSRGKIAVTPRLNSLNHF